jgi:DNA-binding NarL/FixJ family response regulator
VATSILIVDDYANFRASARSLLEAEGFDVVGEAENGITALRLAKELEPEVVLLDVHLPDFDGFEVAERLRELEPAPVVILTSSRDDYRSLMGSSSARAFLRKDELSGDALTSALASA